MIWYPLLVSTGTAWTGCTDKLQAKDPHIRNKMVNNYFLKDFIFKGLVYVSVGFGHMNPVPMEATGEYWIPWSWINCKNCGLPKVDAGNWESSAAAVGGLSCLSHLSVPTRKLLIELEVTELGAVLLRSACRLWGWRAELIKWAPSGNWLIPPENASDHWILVTPWWRGLSAH